MAEYKIIFRVDIEHPNDQHGITWEPGCPLMFEAIQISRDIESGKAFLQTKARNISSTVVSSFKAKLVCHYKDESTEEFEVEPLDADIAPCGEYTPKPIALSKGDATYAEVLVRSVSIQGRKEWISSSVAESLPKRIRLDLSGDAITERILQLREYGCEAAENSANFSHVKHGDWSQCPCGQISVNFGVCPSCGFHLISNAKIENEEYLTSAAKKRAERLREAAEMRAEHQREVAEKKEKRKSEAKATIRKYFPKIAVSLVAIVGVIAIGTGAFRVLTPVKVGEIHNVIGTGFDFTAAVKSNGEVMFAGYNHGKIDVSSWEEVRQVAVGADFVAALKADGSVVVSGSDVFQTSVSGWSSIDSIAANSNTIVGLKPDGTIIGVGYVWDKLSEPRRWTDIVEISVGSDSMVGLKKDGTVVAAGNNDFGECDVSDWSDIGAISAGTSYAIGLKKDGTVMATGSSKYGKCNVSDWTDIVAVSAGNTTTVGVKSDGTVMKTGKFDDVEASEISKWKDIVAISAGVHHTIALKSDGTLLATGIDSNGQCSDASEWKDIKISK